VTFASHSISTACTASTENKITAEEIAKQKTQKLTKANKIWHRMKVSFVK